MICMYINAHSTECAVVRKRLSFVSLKCEAFPEFYFLPIRYLEMRSDNKESRTEIRLGEWVVTCFIVSSWYSVGGVRKNKQDTSQMGG
jgi:hypothetical protein